MSSMDMLDVGQANELKLACRRNDFTPDDLKWLCEGDMLSQIRKLRYGHAVITVPEHLIDLDADPFIPNGWSVEPGGHQKGGQFKWDVSKVALHLSKKQQNGKVIGGHQLREELKGQPVYNANLLDYLLKHPHLIPEGWKGKCVFFWGTIYRDSDDGLCVRYLYWDGGRWGWRCSWLGLDFYDDCPAALRAS